MIRHDLAWRNRHTDDDHLRTIVDRGDLCLTQHQLRRSFRRHPTLQVGSHAVDARPGDLIGDRPDNSVIQPAGPPTTRISDQVATTG